MEYGEVVADTLSKYLNPTILLSLHCCFPSASYLQPNAPIDCHLTADAIVIAEKEKKAKGIEA